MREARRDGPLDPTAYTKGAGRWQVSFFRDGDEVVQVLVDDRSGAVLEQWDGDQVAWTMARGYEGAFGRKLNAPWVWIPLCLLFLLPFVDLRRPFRLLHLDLLVLRGLRRLARLLQPRRDRRVGPAGLSRCCSTCWFGSSWPASARGSARAGSCRTSRSPGSRWRSCSWSPSGSALNVVDSNVIDVGYAGVIGADRIVDGDELYGEGFSEDVERGDTYGPVNYLLYVPFEQALPWSGAWDDLPAAHGAAIAFDLLAIGGLLLLGRALRPGAEGRTLGMALAWAWAAYPYTAFVLETNSNDTLVALACIGALLASARRWPAASGLALGLGAAAKFAPLALAPLFARRSPLRVRTRRWR